MLGSNVLWEAAVVAGFTSRICGVRSGRDWRASPEVFNTMASVGWVSPIELASHEEYRILRARMLVPDSAEMLISGRSLRQDR